VVLEYLAFAVWCFGVALAGGLVGLVLGNLRLPVVLLLAASPASGAGTNLAISAVSAATASIAHVRAGRINWRLFAWMAPPSIVGAVLGSPVGDLGHTFRRLNGTHMSGLPALVVAALADIYPELNRVIQAHTTGEGKALLQRLHKMTTAEAIIRMAKKDMGDMLDRPLEEILDLEHPLRRRFVEEIGRINQRLAEEA